MTMRPVPLVPLVPFILLAGLSAARGESFDCVIDPSAEVKIGSPVAGLIAEVAVDRGDEVEAGDEIARLEAGIEEATVRLDELQASSTAQLAAAETRLNFARTRLARSEALAQRGVATTEQVEQLQAEVQVAERERDLETQRRRLAELELERSRAQLERKTIRAPISGYIAARQMSAGEYVDQSAAIATLVRLDPLRVETFLPVSLWGSIRAGMPATVELEEPVAGTRAATVSVVDRVFDAASGTFGVRLELPNPESLLPAGQRCTVTFAAADAAP